MQKITITNRKGQRVVVVLERADTKGKLVFVMHGLGGYKEQKQIRAVAEVYLTHGYTVVTFDTTNTFGESDGSLDDATTTNYYEDLEDVLYWAKNSTDADQDKWYVEPFELVGHSLGGISVILYAEKNPAQISALAPMSPVVSGELTAEADPKRIVEWKTRGFEERQSTSRPWLRAQIKWSHMEDRLRYSTLPLASKLTMPVLIVVGSQDQTTPVRHQELLFRALPVDSINSDKNQLKIIEGTPHTFAEPAHLEALRVIFQEWISSRT